MQHLEVSCAVRRLYRSLDVKGLIKPNVNLPPSHRTYLWSGLESWINGNNKNAESHIWGPGNSLITSSTVHSCT